MPVTHHSRTGRSGQKPSIAGGGGIPRGRLVSLQSLAVTAAFPSHSRPLLLCLYYSVGRQGTFEPGLGCWAAGMRRYIPRNLSPTHKQQPEQSGPSFLADAAYYYIVCMYSVVCSPGAHLCVGGASSPIARRHRRPYPNVALRCWQQALLSSLTRLICLQMKGSNHCLLRCARSPVPILRMQSVVLSMSVGPTLSCAVQCSAVLCCAVKDCVS